MAIQLRRLQTAPPPRGETYQRMWFYLNNLENYLHEPRLDHGGVCGTDSYKCECSGAPAAAGFAFHKVII